MNASLPRAIERRCPLCDHDNHAGAASAYSGRQWPLKVCARCGFVYVETAPSYTALADELGWDKTFLSWNEQRAAQPHQAMLSRIGRAIRRTARFLRARKRMDELVADYAAPGNVLDVGCGKGSQLTRLPAHYRPFGIEISPEQARYAQDLVRTRGGEILVKPGVEGLFLFPERFFTAVIMRSYLEHEAEPARALAGAARVLAPGGMLFIKVPNYGSVNRRVFGARWCGFRFPDHLNYFTPASLRAMCERAGLGVRRCGVFDRLPTSDNMWMIASRQSEGV